MTDKQKTVTPDSNLGEIVRHYPQAAEIMLEYGLHCVGCFASAFDTIAQGARIHGLSDQEVAEMVGRINKSMQEASQ